MTGFQAVNTLIYRENRRMRRLRRIVDVSIAALCLAPGLPIMGFACLAIMIEDGRPVFFRQQRAGRFERLFTIYKLRTMRVQQCGDQASPSDGRDPRLTTVGSFLRRTSIDEMPQLFNVLRGEMSLIGPRPEMALFVSRYQSWQHLRHLVTPGMTCIWQTSCRSLIPLHRPEATAMDLDYIRRASPMLDGRLLWKTFLSVVVQRGAF